MIMKGQISMTMTEAEQDRGQYQDRGPIRYNQETCEHIPTVRITASRDWYECQRCLVLSKADGPPLTVGINTNAYTRATMRQLAEEGTARIMVRPSIDEQAAGRRLRAAAFKIGMPIRCHRQEDDYGRLWIVANEVRV